MNTDKKSKELLVAKDMIKSCLSSNTQGMSPKCIEEFAYYNYCDRKLVRTAIEDMVLNGELVYDEHLRLHVKEQKQMATYNNIQKVFAALANGKKLRRKDWEKNTYISLHENFIVWTHSNKQTDNGYIGSFGGSWEEYVEEDLSFDDLEVGKTYIRTDVKEDDSFTVLYKTKNLFVARYHDDESEVCSHKYDYTTYKQI